MVNFEFDTSELTAFARDLAAAGEKLPGEARKVVSKGALNVKNAMQEDARSSEHFKGFAHTITYDMKGNAFTSEADIGPSSEAGSPGNLANIAYFGTSRGGGTVRDPAEALQDEAPGFVKAISDIYDGLL